MTNILQLIVLGAIANGMTALCAGLVGFLFFGEKLGSRQSIALCTGFVGILVLASGRIAGMSVGWAACALILGSVALSQNWQRR